MSIHYEFYRNPNSEGTNKKRYHARVVSHGTVSTDRLAREIQKECGLSHVDVKAVIMTLADKLAEHLGEGEKVRLDDIGLFQVNLRCKQEVRTMNGARAENIEFKSVSFRADGYLKDKLKAQKIRRSRYKPHSFPHSEANIEALLTKHFTKREAISRREFQYLTGLVKSTALRTIKKLVEAGKLKNIGSTRSPLYIPTPGHYGSVTDV